MRNLSLPFLLLSASTFSIPAHSAPAPAPSAWGPVPPMDWSGINPTDFADNELEIPYLLNHFSTVANAVVETGPNRGFLNIKVAREPKDNEPYNARIQETNIALSYFYGVKRPWNPYYGSPPVRARLEAMLDFWCKIQGPDGRFSEYKPNNYSLAPTGFGIRAMSQTLQILSAPGAPPFDVSVLKRTFEAQRKAILSMLTLEDNIKWGREYSNQFSGVYQAALSYLTLKPDTEIKTALDRAVLRAVAEHQSPAGFMYEWGGSDVGYSGVHDNNLRLAWRFLENAPTVRDPLLRESADWHRWLSYNLVLQPGGAGFLNNAGINTRTAAAYVAPNSRPMAKLVPEALSFTQSADEARRSIAARRTALAANWPHFKDLVVPSAYSYDTGDLLTAYQNPDIWFPTAAQKASAVARLPYLASQNFVRQANDPRPYRFTYVRRPSYYAIFNSGQIRRADFQVYGLGLVWNPVLGGVLQSVANTPWQWGTRPDGAEKVYETKDVIADLTVGGRPISADPGVRNYAAAPVTAGYPLPGGGRKIVTLGDDTITVTIQLAGGFREQLPLLQQPGDKWEQTPGKLTLRRGGAAFELTFDPSATIKIPSPSPTAGNGERVLVTLAAHDKLSYTLRFTGRQ